MPVSEERFQEVAESINGRYGTKMTGDMIKKYIKEPKLIVEIIQNTYDDTYPREWIMELVSEGVTGMTWPLYGDSEEYTNQFWTKAIEKGLIEV